MIQNLGWLYIAVLLFSITGMSLIDFKFKLALFASEPTRRKASLMTLVVSLAVFLLIDVVAIANGWFLAGNSEFSSNIFLAGELPLEEPLFLILMIQTGMILAESLARRSRK